MPKDGGLTIRQHERREIELPVEFIVAPGHLAQITFSASAGVEDCHIVHGTTVDISPGGAGLSMGKFLPRNCRGILRIGRPMSGYHHSPSGDSPLGERGYQDRKEPSATAERVADRPLLLEQAVKVRRVALTSHDPTYFVGVSFTEDTADLSERIVEVLAQLGGNHLAHGPLKPGRRGDENSSATRDLAEGGPKADSGGRRPEPNGARKKDDE